MAPARAPTDPAVMLPFSPESMRATDLLGNVGAASATLFLAVDTTAPALTITTPAGTRKPTKSATGQWQVSLDGTVTDGAGVNAGDLLVKLTQGSGVGLPQSQQAATFNGTNPISGNSWTINYLLDPGLYDPTGSYTVTVQATDKVGNTSVPLERVIHLDATGPVAALSAAASQA